MGMRRVIRGVILIGRSRGGNEDDGGGELKGKGGEGMGDGVWGCILAWDGHSVLTFLRGRGMGDGYRGCIFLWE